MLQFQLRPYVAERDYMLWNSDRQDGFANNWSANLNYTLLPDRGEALRHSPTTLGYSINALLLRPPTRPARRLESFRAQKFRTATTRPALANYDRPHYLKGLATTLLPLGPDM